MIRLRELREERSWNMREAAAYLKKSYTTYVNHEKGLREPNSEDLTSYAKAYNVSVDYLIGRSDNRTSLSADTPTTMPIPPELEKILSSLNDAGRKDLVRYGRYLTTLDEYRRQDAQPQQLLIRHYLVPAAAGYASPIEGEEYEDIPLPEGAPINADFCITIQGDSMEPYIQDGQMVFVQRGAELHDFDPGIFFVDGDVYCKQWAPGYAGETYLLSANPKREDANIIIYRDSGRNCVYFGKVLLRQRLPRPVYNR